MSNEAASHLLETEQGQISLDTPVSNNNNSKLNDLAAREAEQMVPKDEIAALKERLQEALLSLTEQERTIIKHRFGLEKADLKTLTDLGGMMKIAVIGGGSTYTPELVDGLLRRHTILPIGELCLMDIDATRLDIVGTLVRRMVEAEAMPFRIHLTTDRAEAIHGASFVVAQIRVGGMQAWFMRKSFGIRNF